MPINPLQPVKIRLLKPSDRPYRVHRRAHDLERGYVEVLATNAIGGNHIWRRSPDGFWWRSPAKQVSGTRGKRRRFVEAKKWIALEWTQTTESAVPPEIVEAAYLGIAPKGRIAT